MPIMINTKPEPANTAPRANPVTESSNPIPNPIGAARATRIPPLRPQNFSFRSAVRIFPSAKFEADLTSFNSIPDPLTNNNECVMAARRSRAITGQRRTGHRHQHDSVDQHAPYQTSPPRTWKVRRDHYRLGSVPEDDDHTRPADLHQPRPPNIPVQEQPVQDIDQARPARYCGELSALLEDGSLDDCS